MCYKLQPSSLNIARPVSSQKGCAADEWWRSFRPLHPSATGSSGHRWSTVLILGQITQNNIIFPLVADKTSVVPSFLPTHLISSLYTSASSSPVVYSNVVRLEQLVVTWGLIMLFPQWHIQRRPRKALLLPLICGWQPCLLHQLHTDDLMVRGE